MSGAAIRRGAELVSGSDDRRNARREIFCVEAGYTLTIDQQAVTSEDDRRFDPFPLSNRCDEVPNARHARSSKVEPKLTVEVSRSQARTSG